jgi:hypothetical protein
MWAWTGRTFSRVPLLGFIPSFILWRVDRGRSRKQRVEDARVEWMNYRWRHDHHLVVSDNGDTKVPLLGEPVEVEPPVLVALDQPIEQVGGLSEVVGNPDAVEAMQIAAAGGHHVYCSPLGCLVCCPT